MKKLTALLMTLILLMSLLTGCGKPADQPQDTTPSTVTTTATETTTTTEGETTTTTATESTTADTTAETTTTTTTTIVTQPTKPKSAAKLNGVSLSEYVVVYDETAPDYTARAVGYLCEEVLERTGVELEVMSHEEAPAKHEIVVGETNRAISKALNANTEGLQFSMMAKDGHVAMEGDYFIIAAAAYYFIETYITGKTASTSVPTKAFVSDPIVEEANNYILLIGDGMGVNHTQLPYGCDHALLAEQFGNDFSDGESLFYGHLFPYQGTAHTNEVNGWVTDSAASATALATGYKTSNGRIGRDKDAKDLKSITELAGDLGLATGVMSTEGQTGATPSGFSAHADARDQYDVIEASQAALQEKYGTIINCKHDYYNLRGITLLEDAITDTLTKLNKNDKGFFMMYEEAYIDKHSHNQDKIAATGAVFRFNQAIGRFMEFAFYNPDTMVIITADHETGNLSKMGKDYYYGSGDHTAKQVPVYAYGMGAEVFHDQTIENVQIPKTIAKMWGQSLAADTDNVWPPLN